MIVVDASIAAKWYLNEPGSEEAAALLTSPRPLVAPALIRIEVAGAVLRCCREGLISRERAVEVCEQWEADLALGAVRLIPDEDLLPKARTLALDIRHAIQDCLYLAAALSNPGARVVTADRPFHRRAAPAYSIVDLLAAELGQ